MMMMTVVVVVVTTTTNTISKTTINTIIITTTTINVVVTTAINIKSICIPNFDKISQSIAEILLFRFRKTDGRHIGILFPVSILIYV